MKITTTLTILILTLLSGFSQNLRAEEKESPAMKLIKMMDFSKTAKIAAAASFAPFLKEMEANGLPVQAINEISAEADRFFTKTFDNPEIQAEMAKVYEGAYTKEEMAELLKFYETPLGKKTLETMPQIMQASTEIGQKFAIQNQGEFQAEIQAIMAKHAPAFAE